MKRTKTYKTIQIPNDMYSRFQKDAVTHRQSVRGHILQILEDYENEWWEIMKGKRSRRE